MLKILLICSSLDRQGPTNVILNMLKAHFDNPSDIEFQILTISPELPTSRLSDFENLGIKISSLNIPHGYSAIKNIKSLRLKILEINPNICHSYGFRADVILGLCKLPKSICKISSSFNNPKDDFIMQFGRIKGLIMVKTILYFYKRKFDSVVSCSKYISNELMKHGIHPLTIYTGVPTDYFKPLDKKERIKRRKELGLQESDNVFIYIANLIPRKNPLFLIKFFKNARPPRSVLFVMGDGPLLEECKALSNGNQRIIYLGHQSSTLEYLQISDYYISSSFSEGFPTAVLEAMSVGVKPVLSSIVPHKEMLSGVEAPMIFDLDERSLSDCIGKVNIDNFDYRNYVVKNFSGNAMLEKYTMVYKLITGNIN